MLIFGYAATMEIKHVSLAVLDQDNTQESRELISHFSASRYFRIAKYAAERDELRKGIDRGDFLLARRNRFGLRAATAQRPGRVRPGDCGQLELQYRARRARLSQSGRSALSRSSIRSTGSRRIAPQLVSFVPQVDLEARPWFNEGLLSEWYFVPGVIGN